MRLLNPQKDLMAIADLIELCFGHQMDADGISYIKQLRDAARDHSYLGWNTIAGERFNLPLHGYVWVENNRIVGNLTIIPFFHQGKWIYMVANIAVHPDYRRQGIGKKLTQKSIEHARERRISSVWLHVREDNLPACQLYSSLGFIEKIRRATWQSLENYTGIVHVLHDVTVRSINKLDWDLQYAWLLQNYPSDILWNLSLNPELLRPSFLNGLRRFFTGEQLIQMGAYCHDQFIGSMSWEPGTHSTDLLWIASPPQHEHLAIPSLLSQAQKFIKPKRFININYPVNRGSDQFLAAGYSLLHNLIWMEIRPN